MYILEQKTAIYLRIEAKLLACRYFFSSWEMQCRLISFMSPKINISGVKFIEFLSLGNYSDFLNSLNKSRFKCRQKVWQILKDLLLI